MQRAGKSLTANERYRERWMIAPMQNANTVKPLMFVAPRSGQHDAPCWYCEARGACRHRAVVDHAW